MSNKSRRRADTSRRLSMAAGALLAGAAIPIAAAGSAWADQTSDGNTAPAIPVTAATPASGDATPVTATGTNLVEPAAAAQIPGLNSTEAAAVAYAEANDIPVEVSVDGKLVIDENNQGKGLSNEAIATSSAKTDDTAVAIGGGSSGHASGADAVAFVDGTATDGNSDKAIARGTDATATINAGTTDANVATGADVKDVVTASGTDASASITDAGASKATASGTDASAQINANGADPNGVDNKDVATAGSYSTAIVQDSNTTTASATGTNSYAEAGTGGFVIGRELVGTPSAAANPGDSNVTVKAVGIGADAEVDASTNITATASGANTNINAFQDTSSQGKLTVTGTGASVEASGDTGSVTVSASGTGARAYVDDSGGSTATAKGTDSYAWVDSSTDSKATSTNDPSAGHGTAIYYTINGFANETGYAGVFDGTGSSASATGAGSTAVINPDLNGTDTTVTGGTATATNGGYAAVENDGTTLTSPVTAVAGDTAVASGPGSSADVVDSQTSALTVNNGQSYEFYGVAGQTETNQSLGTPPAETAPAPEVRLEPSIALP